MYSYIITISFREGFVASDSVKQQIQQGVLVAAQSSLDEMYAGSGLGGPKVSVLVNAVAAHDIADYPVQLKLGSVYTEKIANAASQAVRDILGENVGVWCCCH